DYYCQVYDGSENIVF
nr:immunoglobulin light chain junction region [Macaca mulatta]